MTITIVGIFGMNLDQVFYLEALNNSFAVAIAVIVACMLLLLIIIIVYLIWTGN